jgi:hypothetical protein
MLLTHEEAHKQVESAMGAPSSSALESFQRFMSGAGKGLPQPTNVPRLPKEQIKRLPLRTQ